MILKEILCISIHRYCMTLEVAERHFLMAIPNNLTITFAMRIAHRECMYIVYLKKFWTIHELFTDYFSG